MLLTLSLIILVGFIFSEMTFRFKLPRIVGMLLGGILLGPYVFNLIDDRVLAISIDLRQIALIVILLRAGLSLHLQDLKKVGKEAILLSFVPATFEIIGAMILGPILLGLTLLESALLGSILAAVSPAVIVPKMLKMMQAQHGTEKGIPQMIMAGASVDDIFVIVIFTSVLQIATQGDVEFVSLLNLPISIGLGVIVGVILGIWFVWFFKKFHLRDTVKVLVMLSFGLFLVTFESIQLLPFSGLLAVMAMGITLFMRYPVLAGRLVKKYEKIWVFSETLLFVLVGAAVDITTLTNLTFLGITLILGLLLFRSLGVWLATNGKKLSPKERLFTVFAYIPKATVQASIGSIPLALGIANGNTMLTVAVLAILFTAPLGSLLMDWSKHRLIKSNQLASK